MTTPRTCMLVIVNQALVKDVVVGRLCVHAANHEARMAAYFRRREPFCFLPRIVGAALSLQAWNVRSGGAMNGCGRPERRRVRPLGRHASHGTPGRERR